MEIIASLVLLLGLIIVVQSMFKKKNEEKLTLIELIKISFPKYHIINKNHVVMICDFDVRNEPDELAFISLNPQKRKSIQKKGRMVIINYNKMPSSKELKIDLPHLN